MAAQVSTVRRNSRDTVGPRLTAWQNVNQKLCYNQRDLCNEKVMQVYKGVPFIPARAYLMLDTMITVVSYRETGI